MCMCAAEHHVKQTRCKSSCIIPHATRRWASVLTVLPTQTRCRCSLFSSLPLTGRVFYFFACRCVLCTCVADPPCPSLSRWNIYPAHQRALRVRNRSGCPRTWLGFFFAVVLSDDPLRWNHVLENRILKKDTAKKCPCTTHRLPTASFSLSLAFSSSSFVCVCVCVPPFS